MYIRKVRVVAEFRQITEDEAKDVNEWDADRKAREKAAFLTENFLKTHGVVSVHAEIESADNEE